MKIAVIGNGIVGATLSFYLSKWGHEMVVYDDSIGQATKNAVGIVCPWLSQRRNKYWKELAFKGAQFYDVLNIDIKDTSYQIKNGVLFFGYNNISDLYEKGCNLREDNPNMGSIQYLNTSETDKKVGYNLGLESVYVEGGFQVNGEKLISTLQKESLQYNYKIMNQSVLQKDIENDYDCIVLCVGARLKEQLDIEWDVDVAMQKGQLIVTDYTLKENLPIMMPKGEIDLLLNEKNQLVIGATHEKDWDTLEADEKMTEYLIHEAKRWLPKESTFSVLETKIGLRATTPDFLPFYGSLKPNLYVASGLGSSGLTTGPWIAYQMAQAIHRSKELNGEFVQTYIKKK